MTKKFNLFIFGVMKYRKIKNFFAFFISIILLFVSTFSYYQTLNDNSDDYSFSYKSLDEIQEFLFVNNNTYNKLQKIGLVFSSGLNIHIFRKIKNLTALYLISHRVASPLFKVNTPLRC